MTDQLHARVHKQMTTAMRGLMGTGYVPDYYSQLADDFAAVALHFIDSELKNTIKSEDIVIYHGTGEWSALYVKGKLEQVGDTYTVWEKLTSVLGIEERHSNDDFMLGGEYYGDVAKTLDQITDFRRKQDEHEMTLEIAAAADRAAALREELSDLSKTYGV